MKVKWVERGPPPLVEMRSKNHTSSLVIFTFSTITLSFQTSTQLTRPPPARSISSSHHIGSFLIGTRLGFDIDDPHQRIHLRVISLRPHFASTLDLEHGRLPPENHRGCHGPVISLNLAPINLGHDPLLSAFIPLHTIIAETIALSSD